MKEKIDQINLLLSEVIEQIKDNSKLYEIDLKTFETVQEIFPSENSLTSLKEKILIRREEESIETNRLIEVLSISLNTISKIKRNSKNIFSKDSSRIGNSNIIKLLDEGILNPESIIFAVYNGKRVAGNFTFDGYFIIKSNGDELKFSSLRKAAYEFFQISLQNSQWEFWKVFDNETNQGKPLQFYIDKI